MFSFFKSDILVMKRKTDRSNKIVGKKRKKKKITKRKKEKIFRLKFLIFFQASEVFYKVFKKS